MPRRQAPSRRVITLGGAAQGARFQHPGRLLQSVGPIGYAARAHYAAIPRSSRPGVARRSHPGSWPIRFAGTAERAGCPLAVDASIIDYSLDRRPPEPRRGETDGG